MNNKSETFTVKVRVQAYIEYKIVINYIGLPLPLPIGIPPPICWSPWALRGFFTVSSTLRSKQAASDAAVIALDLTMAGSLRIKYKHENALKITVLRKS